jgi:ATPase subunit of ABC transporter with duplicated ATPase domains
VLNAKNLGLEGLIYPFSTEIRQGERVGLIGPNGSGKSHLLGLLAGAETPTSGSVELGNRVSSGRFTQVNDRADFAGNNVESIVTRLSGNYENSMKILARYGLQGRSRSSYDTLSGGQKARLEILYLELEGHNLLLLDEPTDNLDIDSSEALEHALDGFDGTCVSVSHDRSYLEKQDRFLLLGHDGRIFEILDFDAAIDAIVSVQPGKVGKLLTESAAFL